MTGSVQRRSAAGRPAGRHAQYGPEHLERLAEVARLKKEGLTLAEIARGMNPDADGGGIPAAAVCHNYTVAEDVSVLVRTDVPPWRMNRIRRALAALAAQLRKDLTDEDR